MKTERSDVEFPLWRKKVDASLLKGLTPIPEWVRQMWKFDTIFDESSIEKLQKEAVVVKFLRRKFDGYISWSWAKTRFLVRLFFVQELADELKHTFLMSYMRSLEAKLSDEISFLDIESLTKPTKNSNLSLTMSKTPVFIIYSSA